MRRRTFLSSSAAGLSLLAIEQVEAQTEIT
jgi:hypothetical protein